MDFHYNVLRKATFLLLLLFFTNFLYSGSWFQVHEDSTAGNIRAVRSMTSDFWEMIGVGDNGRFYKFENGAYNLSWEDIAVENFNDLDFWDDGQGDTTIIIAGDGGAVFRQSTLSGEWIPVTSDNGIDNAFDYNSVHFDGLFSAFYLAGDSGNFYYSDDKGVNWNRISVDDDQHCFVKITGSSAGTYLIGTKNGTTFLFERDDDYPDEFYLHADSILQADSIPDFEVVSTRFIQNDLYFDELYLAGKRISDGRYEIWRFPNLTGFLQTPEFLSQDVDQEIVDINGYNDLNGGLMWVTTLQGGIWESDNQGKNWKQVYNDPFNRRLGPIQLNHGEVPEADRGRIFGDFGMILKYGFELQYFDPYINSQVEYDLRHVTLKFSGVPDQSKLEKSIHITSSISGMVPFTPEPDMMDSTLIFLRMERSVNGGTIPGERYTVSISDSLQDISGSGLDLYGGFGFSFDIMSFGRSDFDFKTTDVIEDLGEPATKPVVGLINNDDTFDCIFWARDTLYCITEDMMDHQFRTVSKVPMSLPVTINSTIREQLVLTDINLDGLIDLLFYDSNTISLLLNRSSGQEFSFELAAQKTTVNIKKVIPFNANNNNLVDLLILNDSLYTQCDITESGFGNWINVSAFPGHVYEDVTIGDINHDGQVDLALIDYQTESGAVALMMGTGGGYFSVIASTPDNGYNKVSLADLDKDHNLEIIGYYHNQIDVFKLGDFGNWNLQQYMVYTLPDSIVGSIVDVLVHDFGAGNAGEMEPPLMDMMVLASDSIRILENVSKGPGDIQFIERMDKRLPITYNRYDDILHADYNKDGQLDFTIFDRQFGTVEFFFKSMWKPMIEIMDPHKYTVYLQWTPLPSEVGALDYYRVIRDTTPDFHEWSYYRETGTNSILDTLWQEYSTHWYSVQAVYNGGLESAWSDPVSVQNFIELNGDIFGVLDDSSRMYYAATDLQVPAGQSLIIGPGINIAFADDAGFDVYGGLEIQGIDIDDAMIELHSVHHEYARWRGVELFPAPDTVKFTWFSIHGAQTALRANGRPVQLKLGGISESEMGLEFGGDSLFAQNVVIDSNLTGALFANGARVDMRNINIIVNQNEGMKVTGDAQVRIKNAILGGNGGSAIISEVSPAQLSVRYSTVDTIMGSFTGEFVSNAPPVYMPPDSGYYRVDYSSPTIDMGDPADDFSMEPYPNGGQINQGLFGGTRFATFTTGPRIFPKPGFVHRELTPNSTDTTVVLLFNPGGAPLNVTQLNLSNQFPEFSLLNNESFQVLPGDSAEVLISFSPVQRGVFRDTLIVHNNDNRFPDGTLRITLEGVGLNSAPVIIEAPPHFAFVGSFYSGPVNVQDPDGDSLTYVPLMLPDWMSLDNNILSGTPAISDTGRALVRVDIRDGFGGTAILNHFITVRDSAGNIQPPGVRITTPAEKEFLQALVTIEFDILPDMGTDSDSLHVRYFLQNTVDTNLPQIQDTTLVKSITFYPLQDGAYFFKVWAYDQDGNGYFAESADSVHFTVRASERRMKRYRWYMTSFPRPQDINWYDFGYSDSAAIFYVWDSTEKDYVSIDRTRIKMGSGFWVLSNDTLSFDLKSYDHLDWNAEGPALTTQIRAGWNQVGIPVGYVVSWKDMFFTSDSLGQTMPLLQAVEEGQVQGAVYWFIQTGIIQGYRMVELDTLAAAGPWLGYWLKSETNGAIQFSTEPYKGNGIFNDIAVTNKVNQKLNTNFDNWRVSLDLKTDVYEDGGNILGVSNKTFGPVEEPPPFGDYCTLSFLSDGKKVSRQIQKSFTAADEVHEWNIGIETRTGSRRHHIEWDNTYLATGSVNLYLVDQQSEVIINMAEQSEYSFVPNSANYRLKVYASQDVNFKPEIIPLTYKLKQNYPNPFNPSTTIRFGVPESQSGEHVQIRIYDVLGREIVRLVNQHFDPGYHSVVWNGRNSLEKRVATGVYFYRLVAGKSSVIKKMILMK